MEREQVVVFVNDFGRYLAPDDFLKNRHRESSNSANGAAQFLKFGSGSELFSNKANNLLAKLVAAARPHFRTLQMFDAGVQAEEPQAIDPDTNERAHPLLQAIEKREFVTGARFLRDLEQRERYRRRCRREVGHDLLLADYLQNVA